jgi:hypothetical protein
LVNKFVVGIKKINYAGELKKYSCTKVHRFMTSTQVLSEVRGKIANNNSRFIIRSPCWFHGTSFVPCPKSGHGFPTAYVMVFFCSMFCEKR